MTKNGINNATNALRNQVFRKAALHSAEILCAALTHVAAGGAATHETVAALKKELRRLGFRSLVKAWDVAGEWPWEREARLRSNLAEYARHWTEHGSAARTPSALAKLRDLACQIQDLETENPFKVGRTPLPELCGRKFWDAVELFACALGVDPSGRP